MLRFIEFRGTQSNYEAVYRDKPVSKERRDLEIEVRKISSKILKKSWRRRVFISVTFVCKQYCLQCCIHDVSKKILFYYRLIENWLMKRLSGRGSNWTFMRNIPLILIKISKLFNG